MKAAVIATHLELLARDSGVRFEFSKKVERIIVDGKKATGVKVNGEVIPYDLVVYDVDVNYLYQDLLTDSSSAPIFFGGIRGKFPSLGLHNILFSKNYRAEFQHIFEKYSVLRK